MKQLFILAILAVALPFTACGGDWNETESNYSINLMDENSEWAFGGGGSCSQWQAFNTPDFHLETGETVFINVEACLDEAKILTPFLASGASLLEEMRAADRSSLDNFRYDAQEKIYKTFSEAFAKSSWDVQLKIELHVK